jgi:hypothetical protein
MLIIKLKSLGTVRGIYGPNKDQFPSRASFMHPDAADAFNAMRNEYGPLRFSDILRGADESLKAVQEGKGAQMPGYSGHNYGLSFDIDVIGVCREKKWDYDQLCTALQKYGFYSYRQDRSRGVEEWHFNYLGANAARVIAATAARDKWQFAAEAMIDYYYPNITPLTSYEIQEGLKTCGMYSGNIDGDVGPLCKIAVNSFCQAWRLPNDMGPRFQRTLAFIAAERELVT